MESRNSPPVLPGVTTQHLWGGMLVVSTLVMVGGSWSFYDTSGPAPKPDESRLVEPTKSALETRFRGDSVQFKGLITEAAKFHKLEAFDYKAFKKGNPLVTEFSGDQEIKKKAPLETDHLKLQVLTKVVKVGEEGTSVGMPTIVLSITNKSDKHLAYMVKTRVKGECRDKGVIAHNAIAIKPQETLLRTECQPRKKAALHVTRVTLMQISPLAFFFVSRLDPQNLQYEERTYAGHLQNPDFKQCKFPAPWRRVKAGLKAGAKWYDIIDYYTRHTCDEYSFFSEYRRSEKGPQSLPVLKDTAPPL